MNSPDEARSGRASRYASPAAQHPISCGCGWSAPSPTPCAGWRLWLSGLFAYEITGSALAVAGVVAARQLPQLFFGAFAGAVSEAVDRKLIVMLALLVPASISTVLATLATTGHLALWHVALGNLAAGTMWSTEMSTRRRMVGEIAGPHIIRRSRSIRRAMPPTRMIGPLLGRLRFRMAGHARRLHGDGAGAVRRRLCARRPGASPGDAAADDRAHSRRHRRRPALCPDQADHPAGLRRHHRHQRLRLLLLGPGGAARPRRLPRLARPGRPAGRGRADRRADRRHADRDRPDAHGPAADVRRRRLVLHGDAADRRRCRRPTGWRWPR